jgi:hypothetical protein
VAESRERVRNALHAVGLGLPFKHITVNLAPADLPKEGSQSVALLRCLIGFLQKSLARCKRHVSGGPALPPVEQRSALDKNHVEAGAFLSTWHWTKTPP